MILWRSLVDLVSDFALVKTLNIPTFTFLTFYLASVLQEIISSLYPTRYCKATEATK